MFWVSVLRLLLFLLFSLFRIAIMDLVRACERGQALLAKRALARAALQAWWRVRGGARERDRPLVQTLVARWKLDGLLNGSRSAFFCVYGRQARKRWVKKWLARWLLEARFLAFARGRWR